MSDVPIGEASKASGVKIATIRYYEQIGLLPAPPRTEGNRRLYERSDIERLLFIRHARDLGFEIDAIRTLLDLQDNPDQSCEAADAIASARLADVENRIAKLLSLKTELIRMLDCTAHGRVDQCRVIEVLGHHQECLSPAH
ncbi:MerR family transcriptional regulator [Phyllobacterium phragmitis]|uniref:MerR family transcriptional regulator n=1 Tax=Phyllobacterium phragmitis TaxID=2670329 RepID=A0A2S9IML2_9HYPH|nr:helix-turn-helix domain-containing protein [Phyllobacterium phragmitis]PRD41770.1 MerR family transcriptional regulator [Phyllobacterium phragmitis]